MATVSMSLDYGAKYTRGTARGCRRDSDYAAMRLVARCMTLPKGVEDCNTWYSRRKPQV